MINIKLLYKILFFTGWILFWVSLFLPVNTSLGGLTDAGKPFDGFITLFYSIVALYALPEVVVHRENVPFILLMAGIGICDLIMIFSPLLLLLKRRQSVFFKYLMAVCAVYICIFGSIISYHFYPIRYGHYVWCLSFIITALAFILKYDDSRQNSQSAD
jgi:hypothetical protein